MSWAAVNYLMRSGLSWSGRERNNCFLNLGDGTYADVSYLSGVGLVDDARGAGVVDWDGDGDLDVWLNNRSSPKVRFMRNEYSGGNPWLAVRLAGLRGNRDAVGARAELRLDNGKTLTRTVRAGVNYTIQTTKWLHFGLGPDADIESLTVRWPLGQTSTYEGLTANGRYLIVEDEAAARRLPPDARFDGLSPSSFEAPESTQVASVPLGAPLPLPSDLGLVDFDGARHDVKNGGVTLINFWASWCAGCMVELADFVDHQAELEESGLRILACSVDKPEDREKAVATVRRLGLRFPAGMADPNLLSLLESIKKVIFDQYEGLPIPSSLLVDAEGRLARIYVGPCDATQLLEDAAALEGIRADVDSLYLASAYPGGRWMHPDVWVPAQKGTQLMKMAQFLVQDSRPVLGAYYASELADFMDEVQPPEKAAHRAAGAIVTTANALVQTDPHEAVRLHRRALAADPTSVPGRVGLTTALLEIGDAESRAEAASIFESVRPEMREPVTGRDFAIYGTMLYRLGETEAALPYLERAMRELAEGNAFARMCYGSALIEHGRLEEGITALGRAIEELPPSPVLERRLATALDQVGRPEEATAHHRRALELAPAPVTSEDQAFLGQSHFRLGDWEQVVVHLTPVIAADPERTADRGMLGLALAHLGRDAEATGHLEYALPRLPPDPDSEYIFGIVLARTGRLDLAVESFEKVLELKPGSTPALRSLALAYDRLDRTPEAIERFRAYLAAAPGDVTIRERLAGAYERGGRPADAVAEYRSLIEVAPQVKFRLAWILATCDVADVRDGAEALLLAEQVAETVGRDHPAVLDLLGAAYAESGRFEEAIKAAETARDETRRRGQDAWADGIESRLEQYRQGKPARKGD